MIRGNWSEAMDARLAAMTANPEGYRLLIHDPEWVAADEADQIAMCRRLAGGGTLPSRSGRRVTPRQQALAQQIMDKIDEHEQERSAGSFRRVLTAKQSLALEILRDRARARRDDLPPGP